MIELGKWQTLTIARLVSFGAFLGEPGGEEILLPASQLPQGAKAGDELRVFVYKDSEDRPIATAKTPRLCLHEVGLLTVKQTGKIGAFLDWGLDKDLFLPFHEQRGTGVKPGNEVLVAVYLDKSSRLCATMNVYPYLDTGSPYHTGDMVRGRIYETSGNFGVFVAVDDRYSALIPKKEAVRKLEIGETISARVTGVRPDGKLNLSIRQEAYLQIDADAEKILAALNDNDGVLPFTDKADPEFLRSRMQMSKNEFKRAVGRLLKEGKIRIEKERIVLLEKSGGEIRT
ncbi:MAG: S1 RNA-binding domain-containing protein [Lachnospiraceae bacterium]|nr:S1 RNA-binding domain-containing protein [Lachnospiraceae bacterium]